LAGHCCGRDGDDGGAATGATSATSEASVAIYLKPAFHQTGWFYALCGAALIGAIWAGLVGCAKIVTFSSAAALETTPDSVACWP